MEKEYMSHIGGHITLFFTVEKEGRLLRNQGSRGVGINIQHGVRILMSVNDQAGEVSDSDIMISDFQGNPMSGSDKI